MYSEKSAPTRVVQKQTSPSAVWLNVRMRYAPQIAIAKTTTSAGRTSNVGLKIRVRMTAIGR